jgi:hypothetical protein
LRKAGLKLLEKKASVSRVILPPTPSLEEAKISLSLKATIESALIVKLPPPPAPLTTRLDIPLSPVRRMLPAVRLISPPEERSLILEILPLSISKRSRTRAKILPALPSWKLLTEMPALS